MPDFHYRAIDARGDIVEGLERASCRSDALSAIERRALLPVLLRGAEDAPESKARPNPHRAASGFSRERITMFTEDLAGLIEAGVPLDKALLLLDRGDTSDGWVGALRETLSNGGTFAAALAEQPGRFASYYIRMVEAAEQSGTLSVALRSLAYERRRSEAMRQKVFSAVAYPAFLFVAAIGVMLFVLLFVVPQFERAIAGVGAAASGGEGLIFSLSGLLREYWSEVLFAGLAVCALMVVGYARVRPLFASAARSVPGVSGLFGYERAVRIGSMMSTFVGGGVPLTAAIRQTAEALADRRDRERMLQVAAAVRQGQKFCVAIAPTGLLSDYAVQIIRVGEESGELANSCRRIADIYTIKLERSLARLVAIVSPVILLSVSALIAWVIVSVVTALLGFNELAL